MWKGLIVLLGFSGFAIVVDGERIAVAKCKEYEKKTTEKITSVLPLSANAQTINVTSKGCKNVVPLSSDGEPAQNGEFPHHALLGYLKRGTEHEYYFRCGGTLISERHVLTAAHCFALGYPSIVRLGVYDIEKDYGLEVPVEGVLKHPNHTYAKVYHDIALVKLKNEVKLKKAIRPACLWDTEIRNTSKYIATGFGETDEFGKYSKQLMKVVLEEFPNQDCYLRYNFSSRYSLGITDGQMCVGSNTSGPRSCVRPSGGPLLTLTNPNSCTFHVVAVTSSGYNDCNVGKPREVYAKVSHYIDWIEENVWGPSGKLADAYKAI